jgi:hypothetical protein
MNYQEAFYKSEKKGILPRIPRIDSRGALSGDLQTVATDQNATGSVGGKVRAPVMDIGTSGECATRPAQSMCRRADAR